jgi:Fe-S oxidoreductase
LGISPKRALPQLAPRRFSELVRGRHFRKGVKRIALFIDTFTEFYQPHVGIHALELFEQLGVEVRILSWSCCGRPAYSKGVLDKAKRSVLKLKEHFQQVDSGVPIVVLEPSCASMLIEDTKGLLGVQEAAAFACVVPYSKFILDQVRSPLVAAIPVLHHTHCHARSLWGDTMEIKAIQALGFSVTSTQAGCCGMAGSFGYETEHESLSCQIAELAFIPQMKKGHAEGLLLSASGFSCREQLAHLAQIEALHPVSLFFRSTLVE